MPSARPPSSSSYSFDHQGFAGPGLAGEGGEPRPEHDSEVLDHAQLAYPELAQHGLTLAGNGIGERCVGQRLGS